MAHLSLLRTLCITLAGLARPPVQPHMLLGFFHEVTPLPLVPPLPLYNVATSIFRKEESSSHCTITCQAYSCFLEVSMRTSPTL